MTSMVNSRFDGIKPSHNYVIDHGDAVEAITIDDPRYDTEVMESSVLQQIKNAVKNRQPIKSHIITILDGNHPYKLQRFGNITKEIATQLSVTYGTYEAKITYTHKGKQLFKHFLTHGYRSINSLSPDPEQAVGLMKAQLKRLLSKKFGDTLLNTMGHTHKILIRKPFEGLFLTDDGSKIISNYTDDIDYSTNSYIPPDVRWYVNTGSFVLLYKEGVSSYASRFGYDPIESGFCIVKIRDGKIADIIKVTI